MTTIQNQDNQWYSTAGGVATDDYIFLLDIEEVVCKYFGDSNHHLQNRQPSEKYWFGKKDENNANRAAKQTGEDWGNWWWLRSPGKNNKDALMFTAMAMLELTVIACFLSGLVQSVMAGFDPLCG